MEEAEKTFQRKHIDVWIVIAISLILYVILV